MGGRFLPVGLLHVQNYSVDRHKHVGYYLHRTEGTPLGPELLHSGVFMNSTFNDVSITVCVQLHIHYQRIHICQYKNTYTYDYISCEVYTNGKGAHDSLGPICYRCPTIIKSLVQQRSRVST
jgi:hypothetical protein